MVRLYYTPVTEPVKSVVEPDEEVVSTHFDVRPRNLSRWRRLQVPLIGWAGAFLQWTIGPTLRFEVLGWKHAQGVHNVGKRCILTFWHGAIFAATWWWRNRGIMVLTSTNFDGLWTGRVIEHMGYRVAPGSSSRGGLRGLVLMARGLEKGHDVAFTLDGPRGPRHVAKPGPVMLARRTGHPVVAFHIGLQRAHVFEKSWDRAHVPLPFSRAITVIAPAIDVPQGASRELLEQKLAELQATLDRVRNIADGWFGFPEAERARLRAEWNA
jgi:lysophospholipid acyltransferase (LPLAT)-like uncharacterized protein